MPIHNPRRGLSALLAGALVATAITFSATPAEAAEPVAHFPLNQATLSADALNPGQSIGRDGGTWTATHVDLGARPHNDHVAGDTPAGAKVTGSTLAVSLDFLLPSTQPRSVTSNSALLIYGGHTDYKADSLRINPFYTSTQAAVVLQQGGASAVTLPFPRPSDDVWHNIVVSIDGATDGKLRVHVDGDLVAEASSQGIGATQLGNQSLRIGRDPSPINIAGSYRDLRVLAALPSDADIDAFAEANRDFAWEKLLAAHPFDDALVTGDLTLLKGNDLQWSVPAGQSALTADGKVTRAVDDRPVSLTLTHRGQSHTFAMTVAGTSSNVVPTDGLLAAYDFSEVSGSTLRDQSGNGNDATVAGGNAWKGGFLDFTGTNHVALPANLLAGRTAATLVVETNPASLQGAVFLWNIGGSGNAATGQFFIQPVQNRLSISKTNYSAEQTVTANTPLTVGRWQSVAATIERNVDGVTSTMRLYLDGTLVGQKTDSATNLNDLAVHTMNYLGRSAYSGDSLYRGQMSAVRIYDKALTASEIGTIADNDASDSAAETVASIDLAAANTQDLTSIEDDIVLPTWGGVTWASEPGVIDGDGTVHQAASETDVTLTATATVRGQSAQRSFEVTVLQAPADQERAQRDLDAVVIPNADDVRGNVHLPTLGQRDGSTIAWSSSDESIVSTSQVGEVAPGKVTRPSGLDTVVSLTATATYNGATATRTIPLNVKRSFTMGETTDYLFTHFTGTEGSQKDEQIYMATSRDAVTFTDTRANGDPVLSLAPGEGDGGVRDPYLVRSGEGDRFFLIATDLSINLRGGWGNAQATETGSLDLVVWESTDLVNWSEARFVDVAGSIPNAGMAWAPEAFWDEETGQYYVYWATRADGNTQFGDSVDIYLSTTRDFVTFSDPINWIDREHSIIDTTMIKVGDWYYRASADGQITIEKSKKLQTVTASAQPATSGSENDWVLVGTLNSILGGSGTCSAGTLFTGACLEGPELFEYNVDDRGAAAELYGLLADQYAVGRGYVPFSTTNLASTNRADWRKVTEVDFGPLKKRHGGILTITDQEYRRVMFHLAGVGTDPDPKVEVSTTTRCVAGRVVQVAQARNTGSTAVTVDVTSPYGVRKAVAVAPGKTASVSFSTRVASMGAHSVSFDVTAASAKLALSAPAAAASCVG